MITKRPESNNEWADFWRYQIGVNAIPADTRNKIPTENWKQYQSGPILEVQHNKWKQENAFKDGMAIIAGKVWHNAAKKNLYLILVDLDNQKAIDEFCTRNGVMTPLSELAKSLIVEQHKDQPDKAHIIFYATHQFPKKSSDVGIATLSTKLDTNKVPAIEVKGAGEHGLLFCTHSPHKNGYDYEIIEDGTLEPLTVDGFETHINNICSKYGIRYLNDNGNGSGKSLTPIGELFNGDTKIYEGHNRHEALLRVMESLLRRNYGILTEAQIMPLAANWNQEHCIPPLDRTEENKQWHDAVKFIEQQMQMKMKIGSNELNQYTGAGDDDRDSASSINIDISEIPDRDYAEFIIRIIKKTVKREDVLVRQVFYTGLSTYTFDPINLGIIAPTSEGKTYVVTRALKPFPEEDVWNIGNMSTKVLVRQKGVLVDPHGNPIQKKVTELRKKIRLLGNAKKNTDEKQDTIEKLYALLETAKTEIDLSGKILVFLEPPHHELWNLLKPILSHDLVKIDFPYVDRTDKDGIITKNVVVKGWPACIFCSARDESAWEVWPEIQSRFLITSPNMNREKYFEANVLIAQKKGLPNLLKQHVLVSDKDTDLAKQSVKLLKLQIKSFYAANNATYEKNTNAVWIPYGGILSEALPSSKGSDNRVTDRIFSFLNVISLAKGHLRLKLIYGPENQKEKLVVANLDDLAEVLHITQNVSGMPSHKMQFFKETFVPLYNSKETPDVAPDGNKVEERIAVTTQQLADYYKQQTGKPLTTDAVRKIYLEELENNGYIDKEESEFDKRRKIYWPIVDVQIPTKKEDQDKREDEKIKKCEIESRSRNFLQYSKILLPKNYMKVKKDWLNLEILSLLDYGIQRDQLSLYSENCTDTYCICQFVKEYEKTSRLSLYFSNGENGSSNKEIFGKLQLLDHQAA